MSKDGKNLSVDNKSELFRLYEESFATGQVPEDWSHSYLKPIPKPAKDHGKLNGYRILTVQNTTGKLMERIVARKLAQDLEEETYFPQTKEDAEQEKSPGETQPLKDGFCHDKVSIYTYKAVAQLCYKYFKG